MGLDMYLKKKTYVKNWEHTTPEMRHEIIVKKNGVLHPGIKPERISNIVEDIGYWRKANAIHQWFVDNVQNGVDECQESYVDPEKIKELLEICKKVKENHSLAEELLPTQNGFFFGSTKYDDWYFKDIDNTIEILESTLNEKEGDFYYHSSW